MESLDLSKFFNKRDSSEKNFQQFRDLYFDDDDNPNMDLTITLLALNDLIKINQNVPEKTELKYDNYFVRRFLRKWRNETPFNYYLSGKRQMVDVLRSLEIFKTHEVPLFVDLLGNRTPIDEFRRAEHPQEFDRLQEISRTLAVVSRKRKRYTQSLIEQQKELKEALENKPSSEEIHISRATKIYHVTHTEESDKIMEDGRLTPTDNKNIIPGVWFGIDGPEHVSVYGNKSFEFTIRDLGITGLYQGEIVTYTQEVNVILYASDDRSANFEDLVKPTQTAAAKVMKSSNAYVKVSIFVPESIINRYFERNPNVPNPSVVKHNSAKFCIKEKRLGASYVCQDRTTEQ